MSLLLSVLVGLMDSFGLAMFIPLMQMVGSADQAANGFNMGSLSFISDAMAYLGFPMNLTTILFTILFFFSLKGILRFFEGYIRVTNEQLFINKVRTNSIRGLANIRYDHFVNSDAGRIQNTLSGEVEKINQAYRYYFFSAQNLVFVFVYALMAFFANPKFAILVTIGGQLTNFVFRKLYKKAKALSKKITANSHSFQGLLIQNVAFFKYLKATGLINSYASTLISSSLRIQDSVRRMNLMNVITQSIREPFIILIVVTSILIQTFIFSDNLNIIILSLLLFYRALVFLMTMQNYWTMFLGVSGSIENMASFSDNLRQGAEVDGDISFSGFSDKIELRNLSFFYKKTPILRHLTFDINKNETIAIIGESGSGKTTLMNIISGILKPTEGQIRIDGTDLHYLNKESYQKKIGYITQEPVIFNDTVYNNVTFWSPITNENKGRFDMAVTKSSIYDFILNQPLREETLLGNNGINLSGGQKQRISIARELYKDIQFLFLDEATSALDSETEKIIQENINQLKGKYTILIVAHRLSTVKNADKIILLKNGNIESIGTFNELLETSNTFKKMVSLQEF